MNGDFLSVRARLPGELAAEADNCGLYVAAAGFEERALAVIRAVPAIRSRPIVLLRYQFGPPENDMSFKQARDLVGQAKPLVVDFDLARLQSFESAFAENLSALMPMVGEAWLDISGLPTYGICIILRVLRERAPMTRIRVIYTEAKNYFPTEAEYRRNSAKHGGRGLDYMPESLSSQTGENLILETFSGFSIRHERTCLILFAGYEKHRSSGAIEAMNPSKVLMVYGIPSEKDLLWRLELSKEMHEGLLVEVERAEEEIPVLDIYANLNVIISYYEMLYDDYSVCVAPINGKMQAVAAFLAWERFPDIQLSFPLPVTYKPKRFSAGVGATFVSIIPRVPGIEAVYGVSEASISTEG